MPRTLITSIHSYLALIITSVLVVACSSTPKDYPRNPSAAFQKDESTSIGRRLAREAARHPGESGFSLIRKGRMAFNTRIALTDLAQHSLDLQYYIWEADATGRLFAQRVVKAADRGVRVRVLLDDNNFTGRDPILAALDAHPNIEIRMFNPFAHRSTHMLDFLLDFSRVNHRMHNKLFVMDNALAIVGGRNIGDDYFGVSSHANYRDVDIAAGGPVVRQASGVFDHFWNGEWAVPMAALTHRKYSSEDANATISKIRESSATDAYPYPLDRDVAAMKSRIDTLIDQFIWAPGQMVWDDPGSIRLTGGTTELIEGLYNRMEKLNQEMLIEAPYFVVQEQGRAKVKELHERGIRMRALTNSLASNDVVAAHVGHAKHRKELVENGMEIYELRADAGSIRDPFASGSSDAALHAKILVFDRRDVFIGSFNLDPRSAFINTEAGLYIESPKLASQVIAYMNEGVEPQNSYRLLLDQNGKIYWVTEEGGKSKQYRNDPHSTFMQRLKVSVIGLLPIEKQL
jgi:putative cardiolipin synthase